MAAPDDVVWSIALGGGTRGEVCHLHLVEIVIFSINTAHFLSLEAGGRRAPISDTMTDTTTGLVNSQCVCN